jgi:GTP cyclohydrolase I
MDTAKLEQATRLLLEAIGEDPEREGLVRTPARVAKAWTEMLAGYAIDPLLHLLTNFAVDDIEGSYDQIILSRDIPFVSFCEHHLMPFTGVAHVAYIPAKEGRVVGLSKLARLVDGYGQRLQVQERMTQQIAEALNTLNPRGAAVIIKAQHSCQCHRGIKKDGHMVTSAMHGVFRSNEHARRELLELIAL